MGVATGLIGGGISALQYFQGRAQMNSAQKSIDSFQYEDVQNPYDTLSVSTLGADLEKRQQMISQAGSIDALKGAGARGLIAGMGKVQAGFNDTYSKIGAGLDEQQKKIDYAGAQYKTKMNDMTRSAENAQLAGYGKLLDYGLDTKQQSGETLLATGAMVGKTKWGASADNWINDIFKSTED